MFADIAVQHWAFAAYVIGAICICLTMIGLAALLGGRAYGRAKNKPFESGVDSVGNARLRFSAKFYLVAMFFVIFDVEALYLFAWSVSVRESGLTRNQTELPIISLRLHHEVHPDPD